jgi:F-type H+-transporting ATPase subunit epsilon
VANKLRLRLVTPGRLILDEDVDELTAPGALGEFGALPDHINFLGLIEIGEMSYKQASQISYLSVGGGYVEVLDNVVTVLADAAEYAAEIDTERATRAKERAEAKIETLDREQRDFLLAEAALRRALVRLQVAGRARR